MTPDIFFWCPEVRGPPEDHCNLDHRFWGGPSISQVATCPKIIRWSPVTSTSVFCFLSKSSLCKSSLQKKRNTKGNWFLDLKSPSVHNWLYKVHILSLSLLLSSSLLPSLPLSVSTTFPLSPFSLLQCTCKGQKTTLGICFSFCAGYPCCSSLCMPSWLACELLGDRGGGLFCLWLPPFHRKSIGVIDTHYHT